MDYGMSELKQDVDKLDALTDRLGKLLQGSPNVGTATINVNAGGIALWISVTCCTILLAVSMVGAVWGAMVITTQNAKIDRMQDYLNNIYQQAPWLKPKEEAK